TGTTNFMYRVPLENFGTNSSNYPTPILSNPTIGVVSKSINSAINMGAFGLTVGTVTSSSFGSFALGAKVGPVAFVNLPAETNGTVILCTDCQTQNPCVAGGPGAYAYGINGAWSCSTSGTITSGTTNHLAIYTSASAIGSDALLTDASNILAYTGNVASVGGAATFRLGSDPNSPRLYSDYASNNQNLYIVPGTGSLTGGSIQLGANSSYPNSINFRAYGKNGISGGFSLLASNDGTGGDLI